MTGSALSSVVSRTKIAQRERIVVGAIDEHVKELCRFQEATLAEQEFSHRVETRPITNIDFNGAAKVRFGFVIATERSVYGGKADVSVGEVYIFIKRLFVFVQCIFVFSGGNVERSQREVNIG